MDSHFIRGLAIGGLLVALSLVLPSETRAQRSGVEIWEANCGRCHLLLPTNKYEAKDWRPIGVHMGIYARLTSAQRDAVIAFLISGARTEGDEQALAPTLAPAALSATLGLTLTQEQITQLAEYLASLATVPSLTLTRTSSR